MHQMTEALIQMDDVNESANPGSHTELRSQELVVHDNSSEPGNHDRNPGTSKHPYTEAELLQFLRNFTIRRDLGLLPTKPKNTVEDVDAVNMDPRWIRTAWRPIRRRERKSISSFGGMVRQSSSIPADDALSSAPAARTADILTQISDMQRQLEEGYRELNAGRRAHGADAESLGRQAESANAISAECNSLRGQLQNLQREIAEKSTENGVLSKQLGMARERQANSLTRAALLASAVGQLGGAASPARAPSPCQSPTRVSEELAACRLQIKNLIAENEAMRRERNVS